MLGMLMEFFLAHLMHISLVLLFPGSAKVEVGN